MSAADLVDGLRKRGIALSALGGRLEVRPASALTDRDRNAIRLHVTDLLAILAAPAALPPTVEPWDATHARRLLDDADTLVEQLGVSGHHPTVNEVAAEAVRASLRRDMGALRLAVAEFTEIVRDVAREQLGSGQSAGRIDARAGHAATT